jgi:hypothetical protein
MTPHFVRIPGTVEPILGAITTISQFKDLIGSALGVMVVLSFLFGVVAFTVGIITRGRNPEMSKWAFVTAFLLALAVPSVTLMFSAAGLGSATVEPRF